MSSINSWRLPVSSTTDEGLGGEETRNVYVDDEIWVRESEGSEDGWNADIDQSESEFPIHSNGSSIDGWEGSTTEFRHGREPSIAYECHGCEPSIAVDCGGVGSHGREPSIAKPSQDHVNGPSTIVNRHGREPSIASGDRGGWFGVGYMSSIESRHEPENEEMNLTLEMTVEVTPDSQIGTRDEPCGGDWVGGDQVSLQISSDSLYVGEVIPYSLVCGGEVVVEQVGNDDRGDGGFDDELAQPDVSNI